MAPLLLANCSMRPGSDAARRPSHRADVRPASATRSTQAKMVGWGIGRSLSQAGARPVSQPPTGVQPLPVMVVNVTQRATFRLPLLVIVGLDLLLLLHDGLLAGARLERRGAVCGLVFGPMGLVSQRRPLLGHFQ
jgi:hypothetical protein